jgi:hypothetical protein
MYRDENQFQYLIYMGYGVEQLQGLQQYLRSKKYFLSAWLTGGNYPLSYPRLTWFNGMQKIPANIHLEDGKEVRITTQSKDWFMYFRPVGIDNSRQPESIDAIDYICEFTKAELFLLQIVKDHKAENNTITIRPKSYTPADKAKLKKSIPLWIKKRLLIRTKREHYMVNPWFFVPPKEEQRKAMDQWSNLKR